MLNLRNYFACRGGLGNFVLLFIGIILISTVGIEDLSFQYLVFLIFLMFLVWGWWYYLVEFCATPISVFEWLPFCVILVWAYGFIFGFLNDNPTMGVIRNFAGMVLYVVFYFLLAAKISYRKILNFVYLVCAAYAAVALFAIGFVDKSGINDLDLDSYGIAIFRYYYSAGSCVLFVTVAVGFFLIFNPRYRVELVPRFLLRRRFSSAALFVASLFIVLASGSKGYYIGVGFLFVVAFVFWLLNIQKDVKSSYIVGFFILVVIAGFVYYFDEIYQLYYFTSELELDVDSPRSVQGVELINDFTWFGKGLGGVISSGYSRDELGYSFELSFHNMIHKFGVFAVIPFAMVLLPLGKALMNLLRGGEIGASVLCCGLMAYVFPSYGNPFIVGPNVVLMNCLAYYLMFSAVPQGEAERILPCDLADRLQKKC